MNIDFSNDTIEQAQKAYQQTGIMSYALAIGAKAAFDSAWISVEEGLPPVSDKASNSVYLVISQDGVPVWYDNFGEWHFYFGGHAIACNVTHWQPLPKRQ